MLAYARLVPHVYHVYHGIAAYQSGPPQGHKSVPTNLPYARGRNGWFYFYSNGSAPARRRAALTRAESDMGASERKRAVAHSLPRGTHFDPAAGDAPKKSVFSLHFSSGGFFKSARNSEGGLAATGGCMIGVSGRNPTHTNAARGCRDRAEGRKPRPNRPKWVEYL